MPSTATSSYRRRTRVHKELIMILGRISKSAWAIALVAAICFVAAGSLLSTNAAQTVPTPRGQLGGPEALPSESAPPASEPVTTPAPEQCDREPAPVDEILAAASAT